MRKIRQKKSFNIDVMYMYLCSTHASNLFDKSFHVLYILRDVYRVGICVPPPLTSSAHVYKLPMRHQPIEIQTTPHHIIIIIIIITGSQVD